MGLPIVLDVALGLVLVYLALGLIASEIQELLSTVLQWRAENLKYSIEQLLAGSRKEDRRAARKLADRLYESPMIRDLNYEAQGRITRSLRQVAHAAGSLYRLITRTSNVFGQQTSGPSYIPAESFATTLLETLQIESVEKSVVELRLKRLLQERVVTPLGETLNDLRVGVGDGRLLETDLRDLELALERIFHDYRTERAGLTQTAERILTELEGFAEQAATVLPESYGATRVFLRRLRYLRSQVADSIDGVEGIVRQLQPSLKDLLSILDGSSDQSLAAEFQYVRQQLDSQHALPLTNALKESLTLLAARAQRRATSAEQGVKLLQEEVQQWYDRGMARAAGVYRRNAKAVAILIGLIVAVSTNADTLLIVNRLTVDQAVRTSVIQSFEQISTASLQAESPSSPTITQLGSELQDVSQAVENALSEYSLPIGWSQELIETQQRLGCVDDGQSTVSAPGQCSWVLPIPRRWLGWLITGLCVSMGSSFWFDALRRVVSVRNSGNKPSDQAISDDG